MHSSSNSSITNFTKPNLLNNQFITMNRLQDTMSLHQAGEVPLKKIMIRLLRIRIFTFIKLCLRLSKLPDQKEMQREAAKKLINVKGFGINIRQTYMMKSSLKKYPLKWQVALNNRIVTKSPFKRDRPGHKIIQE